MNRLIRLFCFVITAAVLIPMNSYAQFLSAEYITHEKVESGEFVYDYDADGDLDILMHNTFGKLRPQAYNFTLMINDGEGNFSESWFKRIDHNQYFNPENIEGDDYIEPAATIESWLIDADETRDILLRLYDGDQGLPTTVLVLYSNNDGTFSEPVLFPEMIPYVDAVEDFVDFDNDGHVDIFGDFGLGSFHIVQHISEGNFSDFIPFNGTNGNFENSVDLNNDGLFDVYRYEHFETFDEELNDYMQHLRIHVFMNQGNFQFASSVIYEDSLYAGSQSALYPVSFFYDDDLTKDFIVIREDPMTGLSTMDVLRNNGTGMFSLEANSWSAELFGLNDGYFGDYNEDGRTDIISYNENQLWINQESDVWTVLPIEINYLPDESIYNADSPQSHVQYDFNDDGLLDWLLTNYGTHSRIFLKSSLVNYTPGDRFLNHDPPVFGLIDLESDGEQELLAREYGRTYVGEQTADRVVWTFISDANDLDIYDFDNDGDEDLLLSSSPGWGDMQLFRNENGTLQLFEFWNSNFASQMTARFVDYDNDSDGDISAFYEGQWSLFQNTNGTFSSPIVMSDDPILDWTSVKWMDAEGDGDLDMYYYSYNYPLAGILENNSGQFVNHWTELSDTYATMFTDYFDYNHDGMIDIVVGQSDLVALTVNSDFSFNEFGYLGSDVLGAFPVSLNNDNLDDLILIQQGEQLRMYFATSPGVYEAGPAGIIGINNDFSDAVFYGEMKDWDGDGDQDLAFDNGWGLFVSDNLEVDENNLHLMTGRCYVDVNGDGTDNAGDIPMPYTSVESDPESQISFTNYNGYYWLYASTGLYNISVEQNSDLWIGVENAGGVSVDVSNEVDEAINNFGFIPDPDNLVMILEPTISGSAGLCNGTGDQWLTVQNEGNMIGQAVIAYTLDPLTFLVMADPQPDSTLGQTLYYSFDELLYFDQFTAHITFGMPGVEYIGETIVNSMTLMDLNSLDILDSSSWSHEINCSYDPNIIITHTGWTDQNYILSGDFIEYEIQFQNTGSAPAQNVTLFDMLPNEVDPSTLEPVAWSHDFQLTIDDHEANFVFENIMLADSSSNEPESHGFIRFRVQSMMELPHLTSIENSAAIYFDLNEPVITNTVVHHILHCDTLADFMLDFDQGCQGTYVLGNASSEIESEYMWTIDGTEVSTGTALYTSILESGVYDVVLNVTNPLCDVSNDLPFEVFEVEIPEITWNGTSLVVSGSGDFQWMLNGIPIEGAVSSEWTPLSDGNYTASVLDENGCYAMSQVFNFAGINEVGSADFIVFPNPFKEKFNIEIPAFLMGQSLVVYDVMGKMVFTSVCKDRRTIIESSNWSGGLYEIEIGTIRKRICKY